MLRKEVGIVPLTQEIFQDLGKHKYYNVADFKKPFWQIGLATQEDKEKTAFICRWGVFEWNILPLGICNSPLIVQTIANRIVLDTENMRIYIDDVAWSHLPVKKVSYPKPVRSEKKYRIEWYLERMIFTWCDTI